MSILCPLCGLRSVNLSAYDIHECLTHDQIRAESAAFLVNRSGKTRCVKCDELYQAQQTNCR